MIIGLIGYSGAGKDTVAKLIQFYFASKNYTNLNLNDWLNNNFNHYSNNLDLDNFEIKKFAWKLKQICALLVGCEPEDFEDEEFKNIENPKIGEITIPSYRWLLQTVATEGFRNNIHKDIWVDALFSDYKDNNKFTKLGGKSEFPNWIITDVRFKNEYDAIKSRNGIILRVDRSSLDLSLPKYQHESEKHFLSFDYDNLISNNFNFEKLYRQISVVISKLIPNTL